MLHAFAQDGFIVCKCASLVTSKLSKKEARVELRSYSSSLQLYLVRSSLIYWNIPCQSPVPQGNPFIDLLTM